MSAVLLVIALLNAAIIIITVAREGVHLWLAIPAAAICLCGVAVALKRQIDHEW